MVESVAKVKKRSIVYYTRFAKKKYNEKSKENLIQNQPKNEDKNGYKLYRRLLGVEEVHDINAYVSTLELSKIQATGKPLKRTLSKQQASKISEITNVFIQSLLSQYRSERGFKQRSLTFALLTIPTETQNISDKKIISQLVKFIDDLKRVKNYIIDPVTKQQTNEIAIPISNYVWRSETTEKGVIHFHILFDSFVNKNTLKRVWNNHLEKLGFERSYNSAHIHSVKNLKDVGAYVTKYMTKAPIRDQYNNQKRKEKGLPMLTKEDLSKIPDSELYRRPVVGKTWGCSKAVLKLKYIDFVENDMSYLEELKDQLRKVDTPTLPEFISVYAGNIKECLKKCSIKLQSIFKRWHQRQYQLLYEVKEKVNQILIPKSKINYVQLDLF